MNVENCFKGLADTNRLRIVNLLLHGELCGCDIQHVLGAQQSNVSRHLTYLKRSGLVVDRREGYRVYYRLVGGAEQRALLTFLRSVLTENIFVADSAKLKKSVRDGACSVSEVKAGRPHRPRNAAHGIHG